MNGSSNSKLINKLQKLWVGNEKPSLLYHITWKKIPKNQIYRNISLTGDRDPNIINNFNVLKSFSQIVPWGDLRVRRVFNVSAGN